jgi:mono/diheme cytochrome c family protein
MKKSSFVIFAVFAVVFVLVIPFWAISKEGGADASPNSVASSDEEAKALFAANCGPCHTLARGGTLGLVGPDLDDLLGQTPPDANYDRVLGAIESGVGGRMPADILSGQQAEEVADFVSRVAGQ